MKCPYNNFDCPFVDTLDMSISVRCPECDYYNNGKEQKKSVFYWLVNLFKR